MRFDPYKYWQTVQITRDRFYFLDVTGFDKFLFTDNFDEVLLPGRTIYITLPGRLPSAAEKLSVITKLDGSAVFDIGRVSK